jgi:Flp pilus assembly protein TadD
MAVFTSLEQVRAIRKKRQTVFTKARGMRDSGRISEAEFTLLEKKYAEKMAILDQAERQFLNRRPESPPPPPEAPAPPPQVEEDPKREVLGMARDILGPGAPPAHKESSASAAKSPQANPASGSDMDLDLDETPPTGIPLGFQAPPESLLEPDPEEDPLAATQPGSGGNFEIHSDPAGDTDLLSLVRGGFSGVGGNSEETNQGLEAQLHSEGVARRHADSLAREKETEAKEMHEAFRRAVSEKDKMGEKLLAVRRVSKQTRSRLVGAGALATIFAFTSLIFFLQSSESASKVKDFKRQVREAQSTKLAAAGKLTKLQGDNRKLAEIARGLKTSKKAQTRQLTEAKALVAELQQELEKRPAQTSQEAQEFRPNPALDSSLRKLLSMRIDQPSSPKEIFLDEARGQVPNLQAAMEELSGRLQGVATPLDRALQLLLEGRTREAARPLKQALSEQQKGTGELLGLTSKLLLETGDARGAAALLAGIRGEDALAHARRRTLVSAYRKLRRYQDARRILGEVLRGAHVVTNDFLQAGILADMAEDRAAAEEAYKQVLQRDPGNARAISLLSSLAIERQDWPLARTYLEKALSQTPEDPDLQFNLALAYLGVGQAKKARPLVEKLQSAGWPGVAELQAQLDAQNPDPDQAPDPEAPPGEG